MGEVEGDGERVGEGAVLIGVGGGDGVDLGGGGGGGGEGRCGCWVGDGEECEGQGKQMHRCLGELRVKLTLLGGDMGSSSSHTEEEEEKEEEEWERARARANMDLSQHRTMESPILTGPHNTVGSMCTGTIYSPRDALLWLPRYAIRESGIFSLYPPITKMFPL